MKKLTIVGIMIFALGATAFARGHQNWEGVHHTERHYRSSNCGQWQDVRRSPELERTRLVIDEKRLEVRKELVKDKPDWNKIERLNNEIAVEHGRARTSMMRSHHEYQRTLANRPQ